jgi:hypothetical protein
MYQAFAVQFLSYREPRMTEIGRFVLDALVKRLDDVRDSENIHLDTVGQTRNHGMRVL